MMSHFCVKDEIHKRIHDRKLDTDYFVYKLNCPNTLNHLISTLQSILLLPVGGALTLTAVWQKSNLCWYFQCVVSWLATPPQGWRTLLSSESRRINEDLRGECSSCWWRLQLCPSPMSPDFSQTHPDQSFLSCRWQWSQNPFTRSQPWTSLTTPTTPLDQSSSPSASPASLETSWSSMPSAGRRRSLLLWWGSNRKLLRPLRTFKDL